METYLRKASYAPMLSSMNSTRKSGKQRANQDVLHAEVIGWFLSCGQVRELYGRYPGMTYAQPPVPLPRSQLLAGRAARSQDSIAW